MKIDYVTLYRNGYSSHRPLSARDDSLLAEWITEIGRRLGTTTILDLSAGEGQRCEIFRDQGFSTLAFDFGASTAGATRALDLAAPISASLAQELKQSATSSRLTLCLDVLEHIGRADLIGVLYNLNIITEIYLLARISHCPSFQNNLFHASVVPLTTWEILLESAGFTLVEVGPLGSDRSPNEISDPVVRDWLEKNPFRANQPFSSSCFALKKVRDAGPLEDFRVQMLRHFPWLGKAAWEPYEAIEDGPNMVIHFAALQDFYTLAPLIAVTPPDRASIILRDPIIGANANHLGVVANLLRSHGYQASFYSEQERGLDALPEATVLVTGSESDCSQGHLLSAALVAAARAKGMATALLQHGIWIDEGHCKPITFTSEEVMSWGVEHENTMRQIGLVPGPAFQVTGAPKYDIFANPSPPLALVLGSWVLDWSRSALITTNLHWQMHGIAKEELLGKILDLICRHPDWLFIWKLHPAEGNLPAVPTLPSNLLVLSDVTMLAMQLPIQTLIMSVDVVIATQSTALLDAAVCDRASVLLQTDHPEPYKGITPIPISQVRLPEHAQRQNAFRSHYYDKVPIGKATHNVLRRLSDLVRLDRHPRPEYLAFARMAAVTAESFVRFAAHANPPRQVNDDVALSFPFSGKSMAGKFGEMNCQVSLQNGNGACQRTVVGFLLHPNGVGQASPILTYGSLDLTRFVTLSFDVSTGPKSPGATLHIMIESCAGDLLQEQLIDVLPASKKRVDLDISEMKTVNLKLKVDLALGATTHNASGLEIRYPRLILKKLH